MKSIGKPDDIWSTFALSIFQINSLLMRAGEDITQPLGLSSAKWQVLGRLGYQSQTVASLAKDIGHARQSVQRVADVLVQVQLITYKNNPADRRAQLLELTPKGAEALSAIYRRQLEWSSHIMAKLRPEQVIGVANALKDIGPVIESGLEVVTKGG